jgi:hypothetical protein
MRPEGIAFAVLVGVAVGIAISQLLADPAMVDVLQDWSTRIVLVVGGQP